MTRAATRSELGAGEACAVDRRHSRPSRCSFRCCPLQPEVGERGCPSVSASQTSGLGCSASRFPLAIPWTVKPGRTFARLSTPPSARNAAATPRATTGMAVQRVQPPGGQPRSSQGREDAGNGAAPCCAWGVRLDERESACPKECKPAGHVAAFLRSHGEERSAGCLGSPGNFSEQCSAKTVAPLLMSDRDAVDPRLFSRMVRPSLWAPEVAVQAVLSHFYDLSLTVGHDDVHAIGAVRAVGTKILRFQQLEDHRVVGRGRIPDQRHEPSIPGDVVASDREPSLGSAVRLRPPGPGRHRRLERGKTFTGAEFATAEWVDWYQPPSTPRSSRPRILQPNTKPPTITKTRTPTNPSARDIPALYRTRSGSSAPTPRRLMQRVNLAFAWEAR